MSAPQLNRFVDALGDELVAAHRRLGRRAQRRRYAGALAAIVLVIGGALVAREVAAPAPAAAGVISIEQRDDGSRAVTIVDPGATPDEVAAALRAAGIANQTRAQSTGPSRVGTIITVLFDARPIEPATLADPRKLVIPADFRGVIRLAIGTPAPPGEPYAQPTDPFAPGEPLAGFPDRSPDAIVRRASELGLRVKITTASNQALDVPPADRPLLLAAMTAADEITLRFG